METSRSMKGVKLMTLSKRSKTCREHTGWTRLDSPACCTHRLSSPHFSVQLGAVLQLSCMQRRGGCGAVAKEKAGVFSFCR